MKPNIFPSLEPSPQTELIVEKKKKTNFIGYMTPIKGQKIWEYNYETGEIGLAEMEAQPATFGGKVTKSLGMFVADIPSAVHHKLIVKENCDYTCAINIENAVKKFGLKVKIVKSKNQK